MCVVAINHIAYQAVFKPSRKSVKAPWEQPSSDTRPLLVPFQAPPQMIPVSPTPAKRSLIQGDDLLLRPCSHRHGQEEGLKPSTLKSQVPRARPLQEQSPAVPQETTSTISVFAQTTESERALPLDRKPPYKPPIRYQISQTIDGFDDDTEVPHHRPSKPSDPHGQPTQTRLRFDKSVNTDTVCENVKERGAQEPKAKYSVLAVPKGFKEASQYTVPGAADRLDTLPQFLRDLSTGPKRLKALEIETVITYVTSTVDRLNIMCP